jgi:hypothetical protein
MTAPRGLRRFVPAQAGDPSGPSAPPAPLPEPAVPPAAAAAGPPAGDAWADRFAAPGSASEETCELCAAAIPAEHGHIADLETSSLACACRACYLLFTQPSAGRVRYRAVPDRYVSAPAGTGLSTADWDELEIPVGLAFFLRGSAADQVAGFYPSPAGATECVLDLDSWDRLAQRQPLLRAAAPDVEAVLIRRLADAVECYVVPVDACYELAGRMRLQWRGFDGGDEARASIEEFLGTVRSRARPLEPAEGGT